MVVTSSDVQWHQPLQKLWKSWRNLKAAEVSPRLALYTNRPLDVNDPLLKLRDGQRNTLTPRAAEVTPSSGAGKRMREWAEHIGANQEELLEMLSNLEIHTEVSLLMLQERTSDRMAANHLQHDTDAVERGVSTIRAWVIAGVRRVDRGALITKIEEKKLRGDVRRANLVVQAIDHWPLAESATASVDWVQLFDGDAPTTRRQLKDPALWNGKIYQELRAAEERIRQMGFERLLVQGHARLPLWFAVGAQFADTRGYHVQCNQREDLWTSDVQPSVCDLEITREKIGAGDQLVLALSVTNDLSVDVKHYVGSAGLPVGRFIHVATKNKSLTAAEAKKWASDVRDIVRNAVREAPVPKLHWFMSGPAGAALLLGHFWNRVPLTQLYEDLNPGYAPTIAIPG